MHSTEYLSIPEAARQGEADGVVRISLFDFSCMLENVQGLLIRSCGIPIPPSQLPGSCIRTAAVRSRLADLRKPGSFFYSDFFAGVWQTHCLASENALTNAGNLLFSMNAGPAQTVLNALAAWMRLPMPHSSRYLPPQAIVAPAPGGG